jgi:hypothetical protein
MFDLMSPEASGWRAMDSRAARPMLPIPKAAAMAAIPAPKAAAILASGARSVATCIRTDKTVIIGDFKDELKFNFQSNQ